MTRAYAALLVVLSSTFVAALQACASDDETAGPSIDASTPPVDAQATDAAHSDATSGDSGGDAAPPVDASGTDAADAAIDAHDGGPACPIGMNDTIDATIAVTADDYLKLYVNGVLVDDKTTTWGTVDTVNVTLFRHPAHKNVIAIEPRNAFNQAGLDRGVIADLVVTFHAPGDAGTDAASDASVDAGSVHVVTDTSWKVESVATDAGVTDAGDAGAPPWVEPAYDDSSWAAAVDQGANGVSPWGAVLGSSTAHWIWTYDVAAASSKPTDEPIHARKAFYLAFDGGVLTAPGACP